MRLEKETLMKTEWVITIGNTQFPLYIVSMAILISVMSLLIVYLSSVLTQNQVMLYQEFRLARPECSIEYDMGKMIMDCGTPRKDLSPLNFELPKNYSIIND